MIQANHEDIGGYAECYVIEDWDGNHWLDYKSYVVIYAIIFLLVPSVGALAVIIYMYSRTGIAPSKFLIAMVATFTSITLPRLVLEITLILDVWFQFDLWVTVHFLCLYRLASIPFIHLLIPDTIPRFLHIFQFRIKNVVKGVRSLHRVRYYYSGQSSAPHTRIINNDDLDTNQSINREDDITNQSSSPN